MLHTPGSKVLKAFLILLFIDSRIQIISQCFLILRRHLDKLESIPDLIVLGNHDRLRPNLAANLQIYI
jgi:hypothetical protein